MYAEIHSRTWLADFCGLAVDVVASGALAAPFLVTAGMRLLHRAHDYARRGRLRDAIGGIAEATGSSALKVSRFV